MRFRVICTRVKYSSALIQVLEKMQPRSRSGWSMARFCSTHPPVEVPATCALSMPSVSISAITSRAMACVE